MSFGFLHLIVEVIKQFVMDDNLEERKKCSNSIRSRCKKLLYQEKQRGEIGEPEQSCSKENRIIIIFDTYIAHFL